ncbi:hypothetical protein DYE48_07310 [Halobacillus trueperi]|uniref:Uncharacterized protein n=1 Tax=Halobacillus trueperi TaxID=156205 RepID=A0A3E0JAC7_9BACI|nr:hypothetical protein DYE48_07310 [Halobacillus trueperi]
MEDTHPRQRGSFFSLMEWGGWEAARLPWEKEIGEIPQDEFRESSALPHRKVFKCGIDLGDTAGAQLSNEPQNISKSRLTQSCQIA